MFLKLVFLPVDPVHMHSKSVYSTNGLYITLPSLLLVVISPFGNSPLYQYIGNTNNQYHPYTERATAFSAPSLKYTGKQSVSGKELAK